VLLVVGVMILLRGFAVTTIRFTTRPEEATCGAYREEDGRLSGSQWIHEATGGIRDCPLPMEPDADKKLPTMQEIYTSVFMRAALNRPELDLTGYVDEEKFIRLVPVEV
jgi:hypothetical protein